VDYGTPAAELGNVKRKVVAAVFSSFPYTTVQRKNHPVMRLFPFLTKVPKYKRFNFEPRYYDPAKEELDLRVERIKRELNAERERKDGNPTSSGGGRTLQSGYLRSARDTREPVMDKATLHRALLVGLMGGTVWGWIEYGDTVLYIGGVALALYIFIRIRRG